MYMAVGIMLFAVTIDEDTCGVVPVACSLSL